MCDPVSQGRPLDQLQHQRPSAFAFFKAIDNRDAWMVQAGKNLRLSLKPGDDTTSVPPAGPRVVDVGDEIGWDTPASGPGEPCRLSVSGLWPPVVRSLHSVGVSPTSVPHLGWWARHWRVQIPRRELART